MHEVIYGFQQKIPKRYSKALATIVRKLLQKEPEKRPNINKLMKYRLTVQTVKSFVSEFKGVSNEVYWRIRRPLIRDFSTEYSIFDKPPEGS